MANEAHTDSSYLKNVHLEETFECTGEKTQNHFSLERYIKDLKSENQSWKNFYQETKKKYEETLEKVRLNPLLLQWDSCAELLTEDEKTFLSDKPDYKRIKRDIELLIEKETHCTDTVVQTALIMDRIVSVADIQQKCIQEHIIQYSQS